MEIKERVNDKIGFSSLILAILTHIIGYYYFIKGEFSFADFTGDLMVLFFTAFISVGILIEIYSSLIEATVKKYLETLYKAREYDIIRPQILSLEADKKVLEKQTEHWNNYVDKERRKLISDREILNKEANQQLLTVRQLAAEKSQGFPLLAKAYAEYFELLDLQMAKKLEKKKRPAIKAAEEIRNIAKEKREAIKALRVVRYQMEYYEKLFPWLSEFRDENIEDILIEEATDQSDLQDDPARQWLSAAEYKNLSSTEKYQIALERYWKNRKTRWQIGRDYERYIGYLYEIKGYKVLYQGAIEGFSDLGRDIIATKGKIIEVVQCKYWSKEKIIHEKHIFQLYGTVIAFEMDNPKKKIVGVLVTSAKLSDRAKQFADKLGIDIKQAFSFEEYPCIKCNISRKDGSKIYHLPFDQQYDRVSIEIEHGEMYVSTVAEAEASGFRRALRWSGRE